MTIPGFEPREGGIKIVFDVARELVGPVTAAVSDAGFAVAGYYPFQPQEGGPAAGIVRLGAERASRTFADSKRAAVRQAFKAALAGRDLPYVIVGVDTWSAGGGDGYSGAR